MPQITSIPHYGDVNSNVTIVQQALVAALKLTQFSIDGIFGNDTKKAIVKFQKVKGFEPVGFLGPKTLKALKLELVIEVQSNGYLPLSWEYNHPERIDWSNYTHQIIDGLLNEKLAHCQDIAHFNTNYNSLNRTQKINIWGEIICRICLHESGWNPASWMFENMGIDKVTKEQVRSEGLLQLSYQDQINYADLPCKFNWEIDKTLSRTDPNKTIFSPKINLELGIHILAKQVATKGAIALSNNVYWAVLKIGGRYSKLAEIQAVTQAFIL
jgi:Putative peptidoglycan binding domain